MNFFRFDSKNAYMLSVDHHKLFFSYETLVAYGGPYGYYETSKHYSQTTNRHIRLFRNCGYHDFRRISQEELDDLGERALAHVGLSRLYKRMGLDKAAAERTLTGVYGGPVWDTKDIRKKAK